MIGCEEDPSVFSQAALIECIEDTAELRIKMRDQSVVFAAMNFHRLLGARKRTELFVAQIGPAADRIFVRVLLEEIPGRLDPRERILIEIFLRRLPRVMRGIERTIDKE